MSWNDNLRKASFRGVEFFYEDAENDSGRRVVNHEYPQRDDNYAEDMGRKTRSFSITGYVVGDDYFNARDALITACETQGPGLLIHPYLGEKRVICESIRIRESQRDGRMARFSLSFIEAGIRQFPAGAADSLITINTQADSVIAIAKASFINAMNVVGVSGFVREAAQSTTADVIGIFQGIQTGGGLVRNLTGQSQDFINAAADYDGLIKLWLAPTIEQIVDVDGTADAIINLSNGVNILSRTPAEALRSLAKFDDFSVTTRPELTEQVKLENENKNAVKRFVDMVTISESAKSANTVSYETYNDAITSRDTLIGTLDDLMIDSNDDEYNELRTLKTDIWNFIPPENESLPRIETVRLSASQPSLVVAYDLYEDVNRAEEITTRNKQKHPGFIQGGQDLEVLTNA